METFGTWQLFGYFRVSMEILGWISLAGIIIFLAVYFLREKKQERRWKKRNDEIQNDPNAGFQEILDLEGDIIVSRKNFEAQEKEKKEKLQWRQECFNKRFPYTSLEAFRQLHKSNYPT